MTQNILRKIIQKTGLDLHRYRPTAGKLSYLRLFKFRTVLDIGANTGQFAKEIKEVLPEARIYSFEPLKECFEKLTLGERFNFALGNPPAGEEEVLMNKSAYTPSSSIMPMSETHKNLFPHTKNHTTEKIVIKKLDDVMKELNPPTGGEILIKVDVQGFEDKVIEGGEETFKKARAVIIENSFVELYQGQPLFNDIYEKMKNLGFSYKGSLQEKVNKETGEIISEDSFFIKKTTL